MAMIKRLLSNTPVSNEFEDMIPVIAPTISSDQPLNLFSSVQLLGSHSENIRMLCKVDDKRFASASDGGTITIWNHQYGCLTHQLQLHTQRLTCLKMVQFQSRKFIVAAGADKLLSLWIPDILEPQLVINSKATVKCIYHIPNSCYVLACSSAITLLDLSSGSKLCALGLCQTTMSPQVSPLTVDKNVHNGVDAFKEQELCEIRIAAQATLGLPDSTEAYPKDPSSTSADISHIIYIRMNRVVVALDRELSVCQYGINDKWKASDDTNNRDTGSRIWFIQKLPAHKEMITALINVTDNYFCSASSDGSIQLWTSNGLYQLKALNHHYPYIGIQHQALYAVHHLLCLHQRFMFAAVGRGFTLYDMSTCRMLVHRSDAHDSNILSLEMVCDGYVLVTCSEDGSIRLWGNRDHLSSVLSPPTSASAPAGGSPPVFSGFTRDTNVLPSDAQVLDSTELVPNAKPLISHDSASIDRFLGPWKTKLKQGQADSFEPDLIGECLAHSGTVQMVLKLEEYEFASCGIDGLVILWMDGEMKEFVRMVPVTDTCAREHDATTNANQVLT